MRYPTLLALLVLSVAAGCGPSRTVGIAERAQFEQAVAGQLVVWSRAVNNRSLDTLSMLYLQVRDLFIVWPDGERTLGWPRASSHFESWAAGPAQLNYVVAAPAVDILDRHVALVTFGSSITRLSGRERSTTTGRVMQIWVRDPRDGRWRIRAEQTAPVEQ